MQQVLDIPDPRDRARRFLEALDVLGLERPPQEHDAVLGVDADAAPVDAGAAVELALHLLRERGVIERLRAAPAHVERAGNDAERVRLGTPRAPHGPALTAAHLRQGAIAGDM